VGQHFKKVPIDT